MSPGVAVRATREVAGFLDLAPGFPRIGDSIATVALLLEKGLVPFNLAGEDSALCQATDCLRISLLPLFLTGLFELCRILGRKRLGSRRDDHGKTDRQAEGYDPTTRCCEHDGTSMVRGFSATSQSYDKNAKSQ